MNSIEILAKVLRFSLLLLLACSLSLIASESCSAIEKAEPNVNITIANTKTNYLFSQASNKKLDTAVPDLQILFREVIKHFDCVVLEGTRSKEDQDRDYADGKSELQWPNSRHNTLPSQAVDVAPYNPINAVDWKDISRFYFFSGYVMGVAMMMKKEGKITHSIRWGGDWNGNTYIKDNKFNDLVHFETLKVDKSK